MDIECKNWVFSQWLFWYSDMLVFVINLFISFLQALVASGQGKERLIGDLQGGNTTVDVASLQNQLEKLKNELQDKNGLMFIW